MIALWALIFIVFCEHFGGNWSVTEEMIEPNGKLKNSRMRDGAFF